MSAKLTVVIAARNCEDRIEGTIHPWRGHAAEIIVVDQLSRDRTAELAEAMGCKVIKNEPAGGNFDLNRKLGMEQATGDWILYIDTDERPSWELLEELKVFLDKPLDGREPAGVKIPNVFYFLGKPLKHGIYDPGSAEIRMVRKGRWRYPTGPSFHIGLSVDGEVIRLRYGYHHYNVNSIGEMLAKTNQYTEHDAAHVLGELRKQGKAVPGYGPFWKAVKFFFRTYFVKLGFLDGMRGLISTFFFMSYHLTLAVKVWELAQREKLREGKDYLKPIAIKDR